MFVFLFSSSCFLFFIYLFTYLFTCLYFVYNSRAPISCTLDVGAPIFCMVPLCFFSVARARVRLRTACVLCRVFCLISRVRAFAYVQRACCVFLVFLFFRMLLRFFVCFFYLRRYGWTIACCRHQPSNANVRDRCPQRRTPTHGNKHACQETLRGRKTRFRYFLVARVAALGTW